MSEVIVLDTHIWFWFINREFERFPSTWRDVIETTAQVGVSPVSCYEIALAQQKGRLTLPCPVSEWFTDALMPSGISLFPLLPEVASKAVDLSPIHKDPFDRLIIATTLLYEARLASVDGIFKQYPELSNCLMQSTP